MQNKLLPCPICDKEVSIALMGSEEFYYRWMITRGTNKVGNKNCHCRLFMESEKFTDKNGGEEQKQDLIEKWNTRKPMGDVASKVQQVIWDSCSGDEHKYASKEIEKIFDEVYWEGGVDNG